MGIKYTEPWRDDLQWSPSQCYRDFRCPIDGTEKTLYARWRWDNPWEYGILWDKDTTTKNLMYLPGEKSCLKASPIEDVHRESEESLCNYYLYLLKVAGTLIDMYRCECRNLDNGFCNGKMFQDELAEFFQTSWLKEG